MNDRRRPGSRIVCVAERCARGIRNQGCAKDAAGDGDYTGHRRASRYRGLTLRCKRKRPPSRLSRIRRLGNHAGGLVVQGVSIAAQTTPAIAPASAGSRSVIDWAIITGAVTVIAGAVIAAIIAADEGPGGQAAKESAATPTPSPTPAPPPGIIDLRGRDRALQTWSRQGEGGRRTQGKGKHRSARDGAHCAEC